MRGPKYSVATNRKCTKPDSVLPIMYNLGKDEKSSHVCQSSIHIRYQERAKKRSEWETGRSEKQIQCRKYMPKAREAYILTYREGISTYTDFLPEIWP